MGLQCCPVDEDCIPHMADTFRDQAISMTHAKPAKGGRGGPAPKKQKGNDLALAFTTMEPQMKLDDRFNADTPYFYVEIPDTNERLIHKIESWFPLQFGRQVLSSPDVLNDASRIDWKRCVISKEEEIKLTEKFREEFTPFDPVN